MKHSLVLSLLLVSSFLDAQNLVLNGGFESYNTCPSGLSPLVCQKPPFEDCLTLYDNALPYWFSATPKVPDYFNTCTGSSCLPGAYNNGNCVPDNFHGSESPHSGNGYAGFFGSLSMLINLDSGRPTLLYSEYLETRLSEPLEAGITYEVSFFISLSDKSMIANNIGVYFSSDTLIDTDKQILGSSGTVKPFTFADDASIKPQITTNVPIDNKIGWTKVLRCFTAAGGEQFMTIGSFDKTSKIVSNEVQISAGIRNHSYYYIDDVSVVKASFNGFSQASDPVLCEDDTFLLSATTPKATYLWQDSSTNDSFVVRDTGTYWVQVNTNCEKRKHDIAFQRPPLPDKLQRDTFCPGDSLLLGLRILPTDVVASFGWNTGDTTSTLVVNEEGVYSLTITTECYSITDSSQIYQFPTIPDLDSATYMLSSCFDSVQLGDSVSFPHELNYLWQDSSDRPYYTATSSGAYYVEMSTACETKRFNQNVTSTCVCLPYIPNTFSPNGDEQNDLFLPQLLNCSISDYNLSIYNRFGALIFSSQDIQEGWDGNINGKAAGAGTYIYYLTLSSDNLTGEDKLFKKTGSIHLIR